MIKRLFLAIAASTGVAGCSGDGSTGQASANGPHGGVLVGLPGEAGFAEVFTEDAPAKGQRRGAPKAIVAYFLAPDMKSALSPAPADVVVKIGGPDGAAR